MFSSLRLSFNSLGDSSEGLYLGYILWLGVYIGCGAGLPLPRGFAPPVAGAGGPKPPLTVQGEATRNFYWEKNHTIAKSF